MSIVALLLPDFALILFGFLLVRITNWGKEFWSGLEKLTYFVLFPALLFSAIARTRLDFAHAGPAIQTALLSTLIAIGLSYLAKPLFKLEAKTFASGFQTGFRFNSYVGFAIMGRLHGEAGVAAMGIVIGLLVPVANLASVWALAREAKLIIGKELVQNR